MASLYKQNAQEAMTILDSAIDDFENEIDEISEYCKELEGKVGYLENLLEELTGGCDPYHLSVADALNIKDKFTHLSLGD